MTIAEKERMNDSIDGKNPGEQYGYLLVHFIENALGHTERVYMDLSDGDDPRRWIPLKGGEPILSSELGTKGVRDPHIVRNPDTGMWYIVATDLRVMGDGNGSGSDTDWHYWSHHGSTDLIVWQSPDLVHWSEARTLDVSRKPDGGHLELGMAWACECLWVPDYYPEDHDGGRGVFVMYWSSKLFADDDPGHESDDVHDRVLWGVTRDFTQDTYEYGGVFVDTGANSIDTTMIQRELPNGTKRTYRITKDNGTGKADGSGEGIWMESTDAERWWEPGTVWTRVQTHIGECYSDGHGVEGPAVFANHHNDGGANDEWYLFVDVIPSIGYRPMISNDLDAGWRPLDDPEFSLAPHTKHGGVVSLTRAEYERLSALR